MVVTVHNRDFSIMLNNLTDDGWNIKYLFHGDDWNPEQDADLRRSQEFIESIGGQLTQPPYYDGRTSTMIINEILERYERKEDLARGYKP